MKTLCQLILGACCWALLNALHAAAAPLPLQQIGPELSIVPGPINGVRLERNGKSLAIYGDPRTNPPAAEKVLLTHSRRDAVWAARPLWEAGATVIIPASEVPLLLHPDEFWRRFQQGRFHNYAQPSTKVLATPLPSATTVQPGGNLSWEGLPIRVLATPGYTSGAVSYFIRLEGKSVAFTGDLLYGDGQLLDLYSFQDAIPAAHIGGYHGYAARLAELVSSLRLVLAESPDLIVPARGPLIEHPAEALKTLLGRVEALYSNYLSIDALRWYFGDDHIRAKAARVLGAAAPITWMEMAQTNALPSWVTAIDNSRLIRASDGAGLLVDCGGEHIVKELQRLKESGSLTALEHVFISHYHDDHTDQVPTIVQSFGATVLACRELWNVLERPGDYALPCLTHHPIPVSGPLREGASWRWKDFQLTAFYFPGQTLYHQGLLVQKDQGESILFVGDSFTPSGIDDYCLQNRNFLHPGMGYFQCLARLQTLPAGCWLVNQHVLPMFRFSDSQLRQMQTTLQARVEMLRRLFPWDDPNYGLDESWARLIPYGVEAAKGQSFTSRAVLFNHSPAEGLFQVRPNLPAGWALQGHSLGRVSIPPCQEGVIEFTVTPPADAAPGLYVITADVLSPPGEFREWLECNVRVAR